MATATALQCRACLRYSVRAPGFARPAIPYSLASALRGIDRRPFQTSTSLRRQVETHDGRKVDYRRYQETKQYYERTKRERALLRPTPALPQHSGPSQSPASRKPAPSRDALDERQLRAYRKELQYLKDPLKLASQIQYVLQHDQEDKALALARLSSRALANTVSWNHVIDWQMKKGKTKVAFETYNEMKKRAQKPDSYTYLILLRGLSNYAHEPNSLGRALSLYHAMSAPKSAVSPTIIHANAVLKVCARAGDMESIWHIVSTLPERGPHAADNWTYNIILGCMRSHAITGGPPDETALAAAKRKEELIIEGRRLWEVIISRWRAGDLNVDEDLACTMGRLLLVGARPRDWDDVLSLVKQTMDIPRMVPRLGTTAREAAPVPRIRAPNTPKSMKNDATGENIDANGDVRPGAEFNVDVFETAKQGERGDGNASGSTTRARSSKANRFAVPGNSTLSLVMEACLRMAAKQPAISYWDLLTNPDSGYEIIPDLDNMHMHLRILRFAHSSKEALTFLRDDMPAAGVQPTRKTFNLALSACQRDTLNPNVLENASQILDLATTTLSEPGATSPLLFMETVEATKPDVKKSIWALNRLHSHKYKLHTLLTHGLPSAAHESDRDERTPAQKRAFSAEVKQQKESALKLLKTMVRISDRVLTLSEGREEEVGTSVEELERLKEEKAKLSGYVTKAVQKELGREVQDRGWRTTTPRADWTVPWTQEWSMKRSGKIPRKESGHKQPSDL